MPQPSEERMLAALLASLLFSSAYGESQLSKLLGGARHHSATRRNPVAPFSGLGPAGRSIAGRGPAGRTGGRAAYIAVPNEFLQIHLSCASTAG